MITVKCDICGDSYNFFIEGKLVGNNLRDYYRLEGLDEEYSNRFESIFSDPTRDNKISNKLARDICKKCYSKLQYRIYDSIQDAVKTFKSGVERKLNDD